MDEFSQESLTPFQEIAMWRHKGKDGRLMSRERRSAVMRELGKLRRGRGGREATVLHAPGPRGGCRCAECRRGGGSADRGKGKEHAPGSAGQAQKPVSVEFERAAEGEWE
jgi:hypothetical protein